MSAIKNTNTVDLLITNKRPFSTIKSFPLTKLGVRKIEVSLRLNDF